MSSRLQLREQLRFVYRAWRYRWRVETAEVSFVLGHLKAGDTCLDIGGHKGAFTYWMRKRVGPTGKVITFEPQPELAVYLQAANAAFGFKNIEVAQAAVSSEHGQCQLFRPTDSPTPSATVEQAGDTTCAVTVPMVSLDEYLQDSADRPVRLIKCDVEGHELDVFRGAEAILLTDRPNLLFECEQRHQAARPITEVFTYLQSLGYQGEFFCSGQLRPLSEFDPAENHHGRPGYVYNFVFQPGSEVEACGQEDRAA